MPESLKVLRRRVRSISSTQQITRAMEMVAAAKLRRAQGALMAARPFVENVEKLLGRLAPMAEVTGHPLFMQRRVKKSTLVVFTADRGLCGSYNATILRLAEHYLKGHARGTVDLVCVGNRGVDYFEKRAWPVVESFRDLGGVLERQQAVDISAYLKERFISGKTDEINLLYMSFISTAVSRPVQEKYLDMDQSALMRKFSPEDRSRALDYIFEPNYQRVFDELVPNYLISKIYIILAEAFTSEHSSRMLAMNNASGNCDEMVETLTLQLNKARQSTLTGELLDIVGGAEALQQG
ncbi:MAG: ATP synthase F1 subunit gamma [Candidatus Sumerlaeota bacterium]